MEQESQTAPWHSDAFSREDINLLSVHRRPHLIALIGPHNAGKTTYLAAIHLICLRQPLLQNSNFAGSLTLRGWQRIIQSMQYPRDRNLPPGYPPHTPNSDERVPSLLHYTLRYADESVQELLFTDAPGEWFQRWAGNPDESMYPGAVWSVRNADSFLLFVDSDELAGDQPGVARNTIESMATRLAQERNGRPVGIIWSKSDIEVDAAIKEQVDAILVRELPDAELFRTSVKLEEDGDPELLTGEIARSLEFATDKQTKAIDFQMPSSPCAPQDRFLSYRGGS